jgi:hypothetical protein
MIRNYAVLDDNNYVINVIVSEDEIESFENKKCVEYHSWILNTSTYKWEPPIAKPEGLAAWDELNNRWNSPEA